MKYQRKRLVLAIFSGLLLLGGAVSSANGQAEVPGELRTMTGRIRWKKEMGVLPKAPRFLEPAANICAQFFVVVTQPSTGSEKPIQYDIALDAKPEIGKPDYYSCAFEMKVPSSVRLTVYPGMGNGLAWPNSKSRFHYVDHWVVSGHATPVRSPREFSPAKKDVILGIKGMYLTFELAYAQQP